MPRCAGCPSGDGDNYYLRDWRGALKKACSAVKLVLLWCPWRYFKAGNKYESGSISPICKSSLSKYVCRFSMFKLWPDGWLHVHWAYPATTRHQHNVGPILVHRPTLVQHWVGRYLVFAGLSTKNDVGSMLTTMGINVSCLLETIIFVCQKL